MAKLYIITGPAGVGKSTISRKIAEAKEKSALIEGDEIYHQVVGGYVQAWKEGNHLDIFWKVCINTIKIFNTFVNDNPNNSISPNDEIAIDINKLAPSTSSIENALFSVMSCITINEFTNIL